MTSPTQTITITAYPEDRYDRLKATLEKEGLKLKLDDTTGEAGEAKDFGADVKFQHFSETNTLILTVLHGPHLKNFDDFVKKLTSWVEAQV